MLKGKLKRKLRNQRIKKSMKKTIIIAESCLVAAVCCVVLNLGIGYETNGENNNSEIEYISANKLDDCQLSAGVHSAILENEKVTLAKTETALVQSSIVKEETEVTAEEDLVNEIKEKAPIVEEEPVKEEPVKEEPVKEEPVKEEPVVSQSDMKLVSSTAYTHADRNRSASGRTLVEGLSVAGRVSWLHKSVNVYRCNSDGTVGEFLGTYRFDDTGYGQESGVGESKILKGRTIGTIENGTCIDFFFDTESECWNYGRRNVYIQIID